MPPTSPRDVKDVDSIVVLPYRPYGYPTTPYLWDELVDIILKEKNPCKLSRSIKQQTEYELYMRQVKKEWTSVHDFILHRYFGYEKRLRRKQDDGDDDDDDRAGLWEAVHPTTTSKSTYTTVIQKTLVLNDFPYYNAPGIFHYVLWKIGGASVTQEEIDQAKCELKERLDDEFLDFLHWENPPKTRSFPDIDHIHILCHQKQH